MLKGDLTQEQENERHETNVVQQRVAAMTMKEPLDAAYLRRAATIHRNLHDKLREAALSVMAKKEKEKCEDGSKGTGRIIRKIKANYARPLLYVGRKERQPDGSMKMQYYTQPKEVDALVRREWKAIYDGNIGQDHKAHALRFEEKY